MYVGVGQQLAVGMHGYGCGCGYACEREAPGGQRRMQLCVSVSDAAVVRVAAVVQVAHRCEGLRSGAVHSSAAGPAAGAVLHYIDHLSPMRYAVSCMCVVQGGQGTVSAVSACAVDESRMGVWHAIVAHTATCVAACCCCCLYCLLARGPRQ